MTSVEPRSEAQSPHGSNSLSGSDNATSSVSPQASVSLRHQAPHESSSSSASSMSTVVNGVVMSDSQQEQGQTTSSETSTSADVPPRKRSKVSRACDECRRKKVRCNALLDSSGTQVTKICTNCEKTGDVCLFTRVPMKRGPTKGYTKTEQSIPPHSTKTSPHLPIPSPGSYPQLQALAQNSSPKQPQSPLLATSQGPPSPQVILPPLNSHILPPLHTRSSSFNAPGQVGQRQHPMFWKVPYEMPQFDDRRDSIDSNSSSISGTFQLGLRAPAAGNSPKAAPSFGLESIATSDSEDEFLNNNSARLSRSSFQVPLTSSRPKEGTVSPVPSHHSLQSLNQNFSQLAIPAPHMKLGHLLKSIESNLDMYYSKLHNQFPVLLDKTQIVESLERLHAEEHAIVLELFNASIQVLNSVVTNFDFNVIISSFQQISMVYASKSFINNHPQSKILFLMTLVLLNYAVVLSGHHYSIGFSISFSIIHDWKVYKEPVGSPLFRAFMHLLILDNLFSLSFGTPKSTSFASAITTPNIQSFVATLDKSENESLEYTLIGLNLLLISQPNYFSNTMDNFSLDILDDKIKFLAVLSTESELCALFESFTSIENSRSTEPEDVVFEVQLEFSKLCKRMVYLIDEQLDDLELMKVQPLLPLIIAKCYKLLITLRTLITSLISFNALISNEDFKTRLPKLLSSIDTNIDRALNLRVPIGFIKVLSADLRKRAPVQLILPSSPDKTSLLQTWCDQSRALLTTVLTKDNTEGWYS
ncbi:hypothetical protein OGAPHI_000266 [Ogataea philodendri]|uniref:Zn(2)-C6 fungal-type domain-containing protein n=1 Tax=Ogataea philodendri TaxID=1378263 RepID=A0A9P8PFY4_9ASCO|nr:uncharacterized protein OGAPHI_000266 [Ogataea philodendri]KAH3671563.1 hypothetical protein OGAPHI_000266 [Ogataea philodendri]